MPYDGDTKASYALIDFDGENKCTISLHFQKVGGVFSTIFKTLLKRGRLTKRGGQTC